MKNQKMFSSGVLMGFGTATPVSLRETQMGYVVQSANSVIVWRYFLDKSARVLTVAVWLAIGGLCLMPLSLAPEISFALKVIVSVFMLSIAYLSVCLTRRLAGYAFHVDTKRRNVRATVQTVKGQFRIKSSYRFEEIGEAVLRRGRTSGSMHELCLRLKASTELVPVAKGDEITLLAVHDRLMRDLRPVKDSMAAFGGIGSSERRTRGSAAFPMLGPEEIKRRRPNPLPL